MKTRAGFSVGIVEFKSIPKGLSALNDIIKRISLVGVTQEYISGGRLIGYFYGTYESVNYALESIIDLCDGTIIDIGILGNPHDQFLSFISHELKVEASKVENVFVFEMADYGTLLETVNQLLHHSNVNLLGINKRDYLDGTTLAAFYGSIGAVKTAKEMIPYGEMITNVEELVINSIIGWRSS
jgi:microcompartment protein CcmL/EutN